MTELKSIADEAATRFAFSLLRSAYLDLAQTLIRIEEEPARALLQAVENRIVYRLGNLAADDPENLPQANALAVAAGQVQAILRDAQAV